MGTGAPRYTQARNFGTKNEDFGIYKNTRIGEKYRFQLRGELMNAFNRHTFGGIENRMWKTYFGQVTDVSGYRQIQLGARLDF